MSTVRAEKPSSLDTRAQQTHRRDLAFFGGLLHKRHYISGADGNLSVRLDSKHVLTTPTGVSKGFMKPQDMVIVDLDGRKVSGLSEPSSEIQMHLTIYKLRPEVGAVIHAHPCTSTGFACAGLDLAEAVCSELVLTLGRVPLAPYAPPGSSELSESLKPYIQSYDAILMESHGVVAYGRKLLHAYLNMEAVEHCAMITLVTRLLGRAKTLNEKEVSHLLALRTKNRSALEALPAEMM
jgi:L-fuculose-phosphate aldolase